MQNFIIIGDGGIGSNLSVPLIKLIAFHKQNGVIKDDVLIKVCDGDIIESGNMLRQYFYPEDKGKKKSDITKEHLIGISSRIAPQGVSIVSYPHYVKPDNIDDVIQEGDIVLVGVDNYITRKLVEDHSQKLKKVFVTFGGNDYDDGDVNVLIKENGKYLTPLLTEKHPEIAKSGLKGNKSQSSKYPDELSCEEASVSSPQLILANLQVAGYMLEAVNSYLTKGELEWHEKFFDLKTGNVKVERLNEVPLVL